MSNLVPDTAVREYVSKPFHACSLQGGSSFAEIIISVTGTSSTPKILFLSQGGVVDFLEAEDFLIKSITGGDVSDGTPRIGCSFSSLSKGDCFQGEMRGFSIQKSGSELLKLVDQEIEKFGSFDSLNELVSSKASLSSSRFILDNFNFSFSTPISVFLSDWIDQSLNNRLQILNHCLNHRFDSGVEQCDPTAPSSEANRIEVCSCDCKIGCSTNQYSSSAALSSRNTRDETLHSSNPVTLTLSSKVETVTEGSKAIVSCSKGYSAPPGTPSSLEVVCQASSWFSPSQLHCKKDCLVGEQLWFLTSQLIDEKVMKITFPVALSVSNRDIVIENGATLTVECTPPFKHSQSSSFSSLFSETLFCVDGILQRPSLVCRRPCLPPIIPNGMRVTPGGLEDGAKWSISCESGYLPSEDGLDIQILTCHDGSFSPIALSCKPSCSPLSLARLKGVRVSPLEVLNAPSIAGAKATVSCSPGFASVPAIEGNFTLTLEDITCFGGEWQTPTIRCEPTCESLNSHPLISNPAYELIFRSDSSTGTDKQPHHGDSILIQCAIAGGWGGTQGDSSTYELIKCTQGVWSRPSLKCHKMCQSPPVLPSVGRAREIGRNVMGVDGATTVGIGAAFRHGSWIEYGCSTGSQGVMRVNKMDTKSSFEEQGGVTERLYCSDGFWTSSQLRCQSSCPPFPAADFFGEGLLGKKSHPFYRLSNVEGISSLEEEGNKQHGAVVIVSCTDRSDAQGSDREQIFVCLNGRWSTRTIQCEGSCPALDLSVYGEGLILLSNLQNLHTSEGGSVREGRSHGTAEEDSISNRVYNGASFKIGCDESNGFIRLRGPEIEEVRCSKGVWTVPTIVCVKECPPLVWPVPSNRFVFVDSFYETRKRQNLFIEHPDAFNTAKNETLPSSSFKTDLTAFTSLHGAWAEFRCNWEAGYFPELPPQSSSGANKRNFGVDLASPGVSGRTTCQNGKWTLFDLRCVKSCSPFISPNANFAMPISSKPFSRNEKFSKSDYSIINTELLHGSYYTLTCKPSSSPFPSSPSYAITQCIDGQWSSYNLSCLKPCPPWPATYFDTLAQQKNGSSSASTSKLPSIPPGFNTPEGGAGRFKSTEHGGVVFLSCQSGWSNVLAGTLYADRNRPVSSKCVDGVWSDAPIDCRMDCLSIDKAFINDETSRTVVQTKNSATNLIEEIKKKILLGKKRLTFSDALPNLITFPPLKDFGLVAHSQSPDPSQQLSLLDPPSAEDWKSYYDSSVAAWSNKQWSHGDIISVVCVNNTSPLFPEELDNVVKCIDGKWTSNVLKCARNCPALPEAPEGYVILPMNGNAFHGDTRRVECVSDSFNLSTASVNAPWPYGYSDIGEKMWQSIVCQDGTWSSITLMCMRKCPIFLTGDAYVSEPNDNLLLTNSSLILSRDEIEFVHGATRLVSCAQPFYSDVITNLTEGIASCINGQWSDPIITCSKRCRAEDFPAIDDLQMIYPTLRAGQLFDSTSSVQVTCAPGSSSVANYPMEEAISLKGQSVSQVTCVDGKWTPLLSRCMKNCDPYVRYNPETEKIIRPKNEGKMYYDMTYDPMTDSYTHGASIIVSCINEDYYDQSDINFVPIMDNNITNLIGRQVFQRRRTENLTCINGEWSLQTLKCRKSCPPFTLPESDPIDPFRYFITVPGFDSSIQRALLEISVPETRYHGALRNIGCSSRRIEGLPGPFSPPVGASSTQQTVECLDGIWSSVHLKCERDCTSPHSIFEDYQRYSITPLNLQSGTVAKVTCIKGFTPSISSLPSGVEFDEITCHDGKWSAPTIRCEKLCMPYSQYLEQFDPSVLSGCPWRDSQEENEVDPSHAFFKDLGVVPVPQCKKRYIITGQTQGTIPGSRIFLTCRPGYSSARADGMPITTPLADRDTIECVDGEWTARSLTCLQACDITPSFRLENWITQSVSEQHLTELGEAYQVSFERAQQIHTHDNMKPLYRHNSIVAVKCSPGYVSSQHMTSPSIQPLQPTPFGASPEQAASQSIVCIDGRWTDQTLSCIPMCSDPKIDLSHGFILRGGIVTQSGRTVEAFSAPQLGGKPLWPHASRQYLSCAEEYGVIGNADLTFISCQGGVWTKPTFECAVKCSGLPDVAPKAKSAYQFFAFGLYERATSSLPQLLQTYPQLSFSGGEFHVGCANADFSNGNTLYRKRHEARSVIALNSKNEIRFTSHYVLYYGFFCKNCGFFNMNTNQVQRPGSGSGGLVNPKNGSDLQRERFMQKYSHVGPFKRFICQNGKWIGEKPDCKRMRRPKFISGSSISVICSFSWQMGSLSSSVYQMDSQSGRFFPAFLMKGYHFVASFLIRGLMDEEWGSITRNPLQNLLINPAAEFISSMGHFMSGASWTALCNTSPTAVVGAFVLILFLPVTIVGGILSFSISNSASNENPVWMVAEPAARDRGVSIVVLWLTIAYFAVVLFAGFTKLLRK
eukprot:GDKJ01054431.1.p1 GENE.GDKJ01054431.1~~GDKJ01054431.1.p1  ORF type:complete len:2609 (-),score=374.73 GDKJ01054431.1:53-7357(-)